MVDLQQFCATEVSRYDMTKPFECAGFACATDGKICVRIPLEDYGKPFEQLEAKSPPIDKLNWADTPDNESALTLSPPMIFKCERCDGKGKHPQMAKCLSCNGSGNCPCNRECPHCTEECKECEGSGEEPVYGTKVVCLECRGTGDSRCVFDGWLFSRKLLGLVADFPNARGGIIDRKTGTAKFTFDGGDAIVMGMKGGDYSELDKRLKAEAVA